MQTAVMQDDTLEWMKQQLKGKDTEELIVTFGDFLEAEKPGDEPSLNEIEAVME